MDVVPSLCFLLDKNGVIVASNRLARKETGYREADLRGHAVWDYLNKDSRDLFKKFFRRACRHNSDEDRIRAFLPEGSVRAGLWAKTRLQLAPRTR